MFLYLILIFLVCESPGIPVNLPELIAFKMKDTLVYEGLEKQLLLEVAGTSGMTGPVYVEYETREGTAIAGEDFTPTTGILAFVNPGVKEKQLVHLEILDNQRFEEEEYFDVSFNFDSTGIFLSDSLRIFILDDDPQLTDNEFPGYTTPMEYEGWKRIWSDEFGGESLDKNNWTPIVGNGCPEKCGFGNNELQYYREENMELGDGQLTIHVLQETFGTNQYTSSRIMTKDKFFFLYGRVDIRARLPYSQGLWPALWMMGQNREEAGWPECGEIDIMELRGGIPNKVGSNLHYANAQGKHQNAGAKTFELDQGNFSDEFHVFSMIWDDQKIEFFVDDVKFNTAFFSSLNIGTMENPFRKDFYLLMNCAVGGNYGGNPDETTQWPQQMQLDYVRIFQKMN